LAFGGGGVVRLLQKTLKVFADYHQFYLWDRGMTSDAPTDYTDDDVRRRIKVAANVVVIGSGPTAHAAAEADARVRSERQARAAARREERARQRAVDDLILQLIEVTALVANAALAAQGLYKHGGEWRYWRHGRDHGAEGG
jgi:hypothetical protein